MSLRISVGDLAFAIRHDPEAAEWLRDCFKEVNRVLVASNLPGHVEPESLPPITDRIGIGSISCSWLHHLRRAVAFARQAPEEFGSVRPGDDPGDDPRVEQEVLVTLTSHVICHADDDGFYVPLDFPEPVFDSEDRLPGAMLGSSQGALAELLQTAPLLEIPLQGGKLSDRTARQLDGEDLGDHPCVLERKAWLYLYERLRQSVELGSAVRFT
jgi:hypothetical protein